ncbi:hypothetical protein H312_03516, partial [Anncaliia algerae PRA339]
MKIFILLNTHYFTSNNDIQENTLHKDSKTKMRHKRSIDDAQFDSPKNKHLSQKCTKNSYLEYESGEITSEDSDLGNFVQEDMDPKQPKKSKRELKPVISSRKSSNNKCISSIGAHKYRTNSMNKSSNDKGRNEIIHINSSDSDSISSIDAIFVSSNKSLEVEIHSSEEEADQNKLYKIIPIQKNNFFSHTILDSNEKLVVNYHRCHSDKSNCRFERDIGTDMSCFYFEKSHCFQILFDKMFLLKHKKMLDNLDMKIFQKKLTLFLKHGFRKEFLLFSELKFEVFLVVVVMKLESNKVSIMFFLVSLFLRLSSAEKNCGFCSKDGCEQNLFKY